MKRVLSLLLAIVMVFGLIPMAAFADGEPTISFETTFEDTMTVGDTFTVTASLANNPGVASFTVSLRWNEDVVKFNGFQTEYDEDLEEDVLVTDVFKSNWNPVVNYDLGIIAAARATDSKKSGTLFVANFEVVGYGELDIGLKDADISEFQMKPAEGDNLDVTFDYSNIENLSVAAPEPVGPVIPDGAPFTAITTDAGNAVAIEDCGSLAVDPWGGSPVDTPYYHITIPADATEAYIRFDMPSSDFMSQSASDGTPEIGSAWAGVNDTGSGMAGLRFEDNGDYTNVIIPLEFNADPWGAGDMKSTVKTYNAEYEEYDLYYAVGPEDSSAAVIAVFSLEYAAEGGGEAPETYSITIDPNLVGGTLTATDENGDPITEAAAGDVVYVTITPASGYTGTSYTINGELANDLLFQMPAEDVVLSATFTAVHTCTYEKEVVDAKYLKTDATCQSGAVYYKSCTCGGDVVKSDTTPTFISGDPVGHSYVDSVCKWCDAAEPAAPNLITEIEVSHPNLVTDETTGAMSMDMVTGVSEQVDMRFAVADEELAATQVVVWSSSVPEVASVENGKVTALKDGTTVITAKAVDASPIALLADGEDVLAQFTLTVADPAAGYAVNMGEDKTVVANETIQIPVTVTHSDPNVTDYKSFEFTFQYEPTVLTLVTGSSDTEGKEITVIDNNGTVTVRRYGDALDVGDAAITLEFTAKAVGNTNVKLITAKVGTSDDAKDENIPTAQVEDNLTKITVTGYTVSLPQQDFAGKTVVAPGESYTFEAKDKNYTYEVTATVNGEAITVIPNEDGTSFTIPEGEINGNVVIEIAKKSGKQFEITLNGASLAHEDGYTTEGEKTYVQYMTAYTAKLTKKEHYIYDLQVTVNGDTVAHDYDSKTGIITIAGNLITGPVVIESGEKESDKHDVEFEGAYASHAKYEGGSAVYNGESFSFTIETPAGLVIESYQVSYKLGDATEYTTLEAVDGTYTIENITAALTIKIEGTSDLKVEVNEYVKLNGKTVFLVTATQTLPEGKNLAYNSYPMYLKNFQAEGSDTMALMYSYLVVVNSGETLSVEDATAMITIVEAQTTTLEDTFNVNGSTALDINDAQLVYDLYNNVYQDIDIVGMQKFLRADVNGSRNIDVSDAAAVVNAILAGNQ